MSKKAAAALVAFLEDNGFRYDRTNSKQFDVYCHANHPDIPIQPQIDERAARRIQTRVEKTFGLTTAKDSSKRSPEAVRDRQAKERERLAADIARHEAEIHDLIAQRDARMDGLGRILSADQLRDIANLIERRERELRGWRQLMTQIPSVNSHSGRLTAQHRS